ncbi:MAG: glycogen synthase GlgA [Thermosynechococcaceae cyanobacterium]
MRILFVAAEASPIAKAGGMGVVIGSLAQVLTEMGHDVRIFLPYYGCLPKTLEVSPKPIWDGAAMFESFSVYEAVLPGTSVPLYLLKHSCFDGPHIYGLENDDWRFTFFANGAAEFCWNHWKPQIIHCHDWHTGMIPVWMHQTPDIATVFTIHNLAYQGPARERLEQITWCPWYMDAHNTMAAAIQYADQVTTVSPTYAEQIQTAAYGEGLEGLLSSLGDRLTGILNGLDTVLYDPSTDSTLHQPYDVTSLSKRQANKAALQKELGLDLLPDAWLISMVTRLVEQKGIDLVIQVLDRFLAYTDAQFVVLGTGDRYYETQLWQLAAKYPGRMSVQLLYDDALSRRIYAGSDASLMPSRFEPCGISQLIAMRYGCIPIVRRTGGLVDTVTHHDPNLKVGTGYCFDRYEPLDLYTCLVRAWEGYHYQDAWQALQERAMKTDVNWEQSSLAYNSLYSSILGLSAQKNPQPLNPGAVLEEVF